MSLKATNPAHTVQLWTTVEVPPWDGPVVPAVDINGKMPDVLGGPPPWTIVHVRRLRHKPKPSDSKAIYFGSYEILGTRGLRQLERLQRRTVPEEAILRALRSEETRTRIEDLINDYDRVHIGPLQIKRRQSGMYSVTVRTRRHWRTKARRYFREVVSNLSWRFGQRVNVEKSGYVEAVIDAYHRADHAYHLDCCRLYASPASGGDCHNSRSELDYFCRRAAERLGESIRVSRRSMRLIYDVFDAAIGELYYVHLCSNKRPRSFGCPDLSRYGPVDG